MNSSIFLCFECGAKNRIPSSQEVSKATCGKCSAPLLPKKENHPSAPNGKNSHTRKPTWYGNDPSEKSRPKPPDFSPYTQAKSSPKSKTHGADNRDNSSMPRNVVILALLLAGGYYLFGNSNSTPRQYTPPRTTSLPAVMAPPLPEAVVEHAGVIYNLTQRPNQNPFEIITRSGKNYFIKLVDATTGADRVGIFVVGGQRLDIKVPSGRYKMRYASGSTWRGLENLFGPDNMTSYYASPDIFEFGLRNGSHQGYTVELIAQSGGNLDTRGISKSQF